MAKKMTVPWELKYKFFRGMLTTLFKGFMLAIRERHGSAEALEIHEQVCKMDGRIKNMTNTLKEVFKIEENDIEAMVKWWDIYWEIAGIEGTWPEVNKTHYRIRITKCPWSTPDPKGISGWSIIYVGMINQALNPKATTERPKGMCAGDPHCEYIVRIEE